MKNVLIKVLIIVLLAFCIFSILTSNSYATTSISDMFTKADEFISAGQGDAIAESTIQNMSNILYKILLIIGIVVAVIIGIIIGIKFMTGSIEEKAKVKETFIIYITGCIVVFGAFTIWKLVVTILQG